MKIAFLGLGKMGMAMASRLVGKHSLTVWNRSPEKAQPLMNLGAKWADSPEKAVLGVDVVISSLLDDHSVENIFFANSPALNALAQNAIHMCVTTISPACAERLQALHHQHGSRYVSAPVIGRPDMAQAGKLIQFLAGDSSAIAEIEPICHLLSEQVKPLPNVSASVANSQKLCLNFFASALIEVMGEYFTLGEKLNVPRENLGFFLDKALPNPALNVYVHKLWQRDTRSDNGFTMQGGRKDIELMLQTADSVACPLDIAHIIANKMDSALAQQMTECDWSATQEITRQRAGLV